MYFFIWHGVQKASQNPIISIGKLLPMGLGKAKRNIQASNALYVNIQLKKKTFIHNNFELSLFLKEHNEKKKTLWQ